MFADTEFYVSGPELPAHNITWKEAKRFCGCTGLKLPTEAEWEYACRARSVTSFYWGDDYDQKHLWCQSDSKFWGMVSLPQPVGKKMCNGYGLYDMSGNVAEWCSDIYSSYRDQRQINPTGPPLSSRQRDRVVRGGSCRDSFIYCRSAARRSCEATYTGAIGIRGVYRVR